MFPSSLLLCKGGFLHIGIVPEEVILLLSPQEIVPEL